MTGKFRLTVLIIIAALLAACQAPATRVDGDDNVGITGIYTLEKVDGIAVPGTVSHDGTLMQINSGIFIISADGTCFSRSRFLPPGGGEQTREVSARYSLDGNRLIMKWKGAGTTEGTVEGDTFVMDNHGMIFEYSRS